MIAAGKQYRIKGNSDYFRDKYGTLHPIIKIEGEDTELFPGGWQGSNAAACIIFGYRCGIDRLPFTGKVYYGHEISTDLGELVHETELEPWGDEGEPPPFQGNRLDAIKNITFETSDPGLNPAVFKMAKEYAENFRRRNED